MNYDYIKAGRSLYHAMKNDYLCSENVFAYLSSEPALSVSSQK